MNAKLQAIIARVLEVDEARITRDTSVASEPRWDSLKHMTLVFALEDAYGLQFADDELAGLTSVEAIERALAARGA